MHPQDNTKARHGREGASTIQTCFPLEWHELPTAARMRGFLGWTMPSNHDGRNQLTPVRLEPEMEPRALPSASLPFNYKRLFGSKWPFVGTQALKGKRLAPDQTKKKR